MSPSATRTLAIRPGCLVAISYSTASMRPLPNAKAAGNSAVCRPNHQGPATIAATTNAPAINHFLTLLSAITPSPLGDLRRVDAFAPDELSMVGDLALVLYDQLFRFRRGFWIVR